MLEIVLLVLSIIAARRFRKAGERGVWKSILSAWLSLLVLVIIGVGVDYLFMVPAFPSLTVVFVIAGYVVSFAIIGNAVASGKKYMEYRERNKVSEE
jgi:hypothetical protein